MDIMPLRSHRVGEKERDTGITVIFAEGIRRSGLAAWERSVELHV